MSFSFGRNARETIVRDIANLRTFRHGGISGRQGGCTRTGRLPRQYVQGLSDAYYVVYCYDTPIAWVAMNEDETDRRNYLPDWQYSATTTYYQGLVWEAWGDRCVDPAPAFSRAENQGTDRGRSHDARYGRSGGRGPRPGDDPARLDGGNVSQAAEVRDHERVLEDIEQTLSTYKRWTPAHP